MIVETRIENWDDAYANGAHIEGAADYPPRWQRLAAAFRADHGARAETDIAYGSAPRQRFDLFRPVGAARGLVVFIHGGYWRAFDKSLWSHLAAGPLARDWAVAMPSYTLAPDAKIAEIAVEIAAAIAAAAGKVEGPVRLTGHSAGGHLAARMICADQPLPAAVSARIARVVSIAGVHDLRPLIRTAINDDLRLDAEEAAAASPALRTPAPGARLLTWVGGNERPEFRRQSALLANIWAGLGAATAAHEMPGKHHFDVIDDLADPESDLVAELLA
ncbi:alpha/beta fold hydrolase [Pikeienuella piscinae]|uniref:Alpha/beta fold hydrolase n=1 Tax=Pikeienuella piscinae TaxID=2748098 RepID=A0A7L5BUG4_9RHOB|nr:alpha/beta hydrolase [Pikeienuella piscinae]QIE54027.1 alpha/beta fold hydrolase [Pikeienuella piscinae]